MQILMNTGKNMSLKISNYGERILKIKHLQVQIGKIDKKILQTTFLDFSRLLS